VIQRPGHCVPLALSRNAPSPRKYGQQRSCTCTIYLRDVEGSLVPIVGVKIWAECIEFCSSFVSETLLLQVSKRPKKAANFDVNCRRLQLATSQQLVITESIFSKGS